MNKRVVRYIFVICVLLAFSVSSSAQFREEAFTQTYNDSTDVQDGQKDSTDKLFSFRELFGGLSHKREMRIGTMTGASFFLPGVSQIYNRDYWKLPVIYGGIGTCAGVGGYYLHEYNVSKKAYEADLAVNPNTTLSVNNKAKTTGTILMVGAGLFYWASLMDGAVCYHPDRQPLPGRATVYSLLLPGLGQAYNGEFWKIPIYWGCLMGAGHFLYTNNTNYVRFKRIHNETYQPGYSQSISRETAKYYRDSYRRYRDYSILAVVGFYLLQVIDANVFAYMHDFEVSDDLAVSIEPAVIAPDNAYAFGGSAIAGGSGGSAGAVPCGTFGGNALGFRLGVRF